MLQDPRMVPADLAELKVLPLKVQLFGLFQATGFCMTKVTDFHEPALSPRIAKKLKFNVLILSFAVPQDDNIFVSHYVYVLVFLLEDHSLLTALAWIKSFPSRYLNTFWQTWIGNHSKMSYAASSICRAISEISTFSLVSRIFSS